MNQEKIMEYVEKLAQSLGVAAEHVWETLVKQSYVVGVVQLVVAGVVVLLSTFFVWLLIKTLKIRNKKVEANKKRNYSFEMESTDDEDYAVFFSVLAILSCISIAITLFSVGFLKVMNPDYYAIKELLDVIGGNK